jgi:hypothetical protein
MRDVIIAVAIVLCLGCAGPHQSGTQTHSVEPARRSDSAAGRRETITELVEKSDVPPDVLRFRSEGRVGYARYRMDERVLLFLTRRHDELIQVHPACYIAGEPATGGLALRPLEDYLDFIKSEIKSKKNGM